ncbi:hypothetical protein C8R46DRAFT_288570 [Mycena filopes]|nr:hypothetical protein C8R46DRAFT_288570 [Mycena filopes]
MLWRDLGSALGICVQNSLLLACLGLAVRSEGSYLIFLVPNQRLNPTAQESIARALAGSHACAVNSVRARERI